MFKSFRKSVLIVAALAATFILLPVLPRALTAETEPRSAEITPANASGAEKASKKDEKSQKSAREKLAINKLVIEKPSPKEPVREPVPKEKPVPKEPVPEEPVPEEPVPEEPVLEEPAPDIDQGRKQRLVSAGATQVPMLPGPSREVSKERPAAPPAAKQKWPRDNRLWISAPRLGLENVLVGDSPEQSYLDREGIMHLSGTGFPRKQGSNTYIAGHAADYDESRVPNVFQNLHTLRQGDLIVLRDTAGKTYKYRAYEYHIVRPRDVWVTEPVPGKQVVSLQTCYPAPAFDKRLVVRAQLVEE